MFYSEDGATDYLDSALNNYERKFNDSFPIYEYLEITRADTKYDFSIKGCKELAKFIEECIKTNKPVIKPDGYDLRKY
ncbi:hypothetical protein [Paucilactobacillus sp. N302-9]